MKVEVALGLLLGFLDQAQKIGAAINNARAEGRDDLTKEEVDEFARRDDEASARVEEWLRERGA